MKIILIMALIGAVLYAIDMLVCKISPKAGYIFAIFNLPFLPVGIVTFILTQKYLEKTLGVSDVTQYFRESGESAKQKKKTEATESQTSAETIVNTKKSESVNGKHGRLIFNDPYGKFSHQTSSIKSRAHNANIEIGVQEKDRQPIALIIPEETTEIKDSEHKKREEGPTAEDLECMYIDPVNPSHPPRTVTIEEVASRLYGPEYGKNK